MSFLKVIEASTWGWLAQWLVVFVDHNLDIIVVFCSIGNPIQGLVNKKVFGFEILETSSGLAFWQSWRFRSPEGATGVGFLGLSRLGAPRMQDPNSWLECFRCFPFVFFQTQELGKFGKWGLLVHSTFLWSFTKKIEPACNFMQSVLCSNISFNHSTQTPLTVGEHAKIIGIS